MQQGSDILQHQDALLHCTHSEASYESQPSWQPMRATGLHMLRGCLPMCRFLPFPLLCAEGSLLSSTQIILQTQHIVRKIAQKRPVKAAEARPQVGHMMLHTAAGHILASTAWHMKTFPLNGMPSAHSALRQRHYIALGATAPRQSRLWLQAALGVHSCAMRRIHFCCTKRSNHKLSALLRMCSWACVHTMSMHSELQRTGSIWKQQRQSPRCQQHMLPMARWHSDTWEQRRPHILAAISKRCLSPSVHGFARDERTGCEMECMHHATLQLCLHQPAHVQLSWACVHAMSTHGKLQLEWQLQQRQHQSPCRQPHMPLMASWHMTSGSSSFLTFWPPSARHARHHLSTALPQHSGTTL